MKNIIKPAEFNKKTLLECPGYYRWFCPISIFDDLIKGCTSATLKEEFEKFKIDTQFKKEKINGVWCYYIYAGVAIGQTLGDRLEKHINKTWKVSTLRKTIGALKNSSNEKVISDIVNSFFVEPNLSTNGVGSEEAKKEALDYENREIQTNLLPFNIEKNHNPKLRRFRAELTKIRTCTFNKI